MIPAPEPPYASDGPPPAEPRVPELMEIYRAHVDYVWRIARSLGIPADAAEDVTQEVFLCVHHKLHTFRPGGSMRAWLFGITRNLVLHDRRSYARRERHLAALSQPTATTREPDATVRVRQAAELMQSFLDELDLDKRLVFQMTEIEEMTAEEIAEALTIPLGTVYSRLRAARAKLERFRLRLHARSERRHV
ncbi:MULTISPECIES: RNA polymerase sigma factor [Nannocystis]|uniref:RNA polymerase sigma factor n=1 Tax=Nannocystis radixulma TaxID=2995305 RepID=A0ABT5B527_9BACT|nr:MULTISPECIES: RNA polymerase sigma factor [Nannocystis]MCY1060850.1 RNA polymerase sigma factor [Nannocystis sp. SCPEA4]MDC0668624.1 RNA polymerase sigma factor [Nannocystis radixulma]